MANRNRIRTRTKSVSLAKLNKGPAISNENKKPAISNENKKPAIRNGNKTPVVVKENKRPAVSNDSKKPAVSKTKKKRLGFLDLPGEIRNDIYAYCFEDEIWIDMTPTAEHILKQNKVQPGTWASAHLSAANTAATGSNNPTNPSPRPKPRKIAYKPLPRGRRQHATVDSPPPPPTNWPTSAGALVRTCRQIHAEALPFFYALPFFIFSAPRALLRFLALLPPPKLALVRKLHVAHATYGDPMRPGDEVWRERHDRAWARAMDEAARLLTGLRVLRCRVVANERPLVFALPSAAWAAALVEAWGPACRREMPEEREVRAGAPDPLRVEIAVQSAWVVKGAYMPNEVLRGALVELHRLFAEAVRRRLCGWSEEDAMVEFNLVKFDKYKRLSELYPMP